MYIYIYICIIIYMYTVDCIHMNPQKNHCILPMVSGQDVSGIFNDCH